MRKANVDAVTARREIQQYHQMKGELETQIVKAQKDLELLKHRQIEEAEERTHREQYHAIAREIVKLPSRSQMETEIQSVETEVQRLTTEVAKVQSHIEIRSKQFSLLLTAIENLQKELEEPIVRAEAYATPMTSSSPVLAPAASPVLSSASLRGNDGTMDMIE